MPNNKTRPKFGFSHYSVQAFCIFVKFVIQSLTGNIHFPMVTPSLLVLQTALDDFVLSAVSAESRDKAKIVDRNTKRQVLESLMKELAGYLMSVTSQRDVLVTTGMELTQARGPVMPVTPPLSFTYSFIKGVSGSLELKWQRPASKNAVSYLIEQTTGDPSHPDTVWKVVGSSRKCRYIATGLVPCNTYSFRVYGIGALGAGGRSLAISAFAV